MKNLIYKLVITVLFVCTAGFVRAQSDLQTFRTNYERLQQIYSPNEPDAILMADSLARISEQPYKALYNYLVSTMLPKLRPYMGLKSDVHNIRDVMKWSQEEVYDNMFRYADTAFSQLFTYGLIPADGFEFMMRPGNISSLPGMTLMDVALLSLIDYHLYPCDKYIDSAIALHRERNDRELLIEYELYLLDLEYKDFPKERDPNHYGQALSALRQKYGQSAAIDYENAMFLYNLVEHYDHKERQNDTIPEELRKEYSLWSERFFREVKNSAKESFYRENAAIMLEHITRPEVLPRSNMSEYLMPAAKILLPINYRNVDTLYVTAYRNVDENGFFILSHSRFPDLRGPDYVGPVTQQRFVLPQAMPHRFRSTDLFLDSLPVGNWLLLYHKTPVCDSASTLMAQKLTVTNIKAEQVTMGKHATVIFTEARTGKPLKGLKVVKEEMDEDYNFHRFHCRTDRLGRIRVLNYKDWEFFVHDGPDCVFSFLNDNLEYEDMDRKSRRQEVARRYSLDRYTTADFSRIILDRTLYRPGQTVFFNVYLINGRRMQTNTPLTAILKDIDGKEISRISLKTNEFGTASGNFVLPEDLTRQGNIFIRNEKGEMVDWQRFYVAAYKLPTFHVRLDELKGSVSASDTLHFSGRAVTFTGDPIGNASVSVRLESDKDPNLRYDLQTDLEGRFSFIYKSQDTNIRWLPLHVYVSVTDINGETQQVDKDFTLYQKPFDVYIFTEDVDLSQSDTFRSKISIQKDGSRKINLPTKVEIYRVQEPESYKPLIYYGYFKPDCPIASDEEYQRYFPQYSFDKRDGEPRTWPSLERVYTQEGFMPNGDSLAIAVNHWGTGLYRIVVSAQDSLGRTDSAVRLFYIQNLASNIVATAQPIDLQILNIKQKTLDISLATRLKDATVFCEVFQNGRKRFSRQLHLSEERQCFPVKIRPEYSIVSVVCHTTKDNKNYAVRDFKPAGESKLQHTTPGVLELRLTRWNRKLQPGDSMSWEIEVVNATTGKPEPSELLIWMVDTALYTLQKAYSPSSQWITALGGVKKVRVPNFACMLINCQNLMPEYPFIDELNYYYPEKKSLQRLDRKYDVFALSQFPSDYRYSSTNFSWDFFQMDHTSSTSIGRLSGENIRTTPGRSVTTEYKDPFADVVTELESEKFGGEQGDAEPQNRFRIRRDFRETAFFLPQLQTNESGRVVFTFTVPDQLTTWRFYAQAHTKNLHTGHLSGSIVAKLPMMLQSNAPRFLREGDTMDLRAKITNVSEERLSGTVTLEIVDTVGDQQINLILDDSGRDAMNRVSTTRTVDFNLNAGTAQEVHFRIIVPEGTSSVTYRLVAKAGNYGDGEERTLPVLPKRMLVTEAYPFFVPENSDTTLLYNRFRTHITPTLAQERFTVEATTNPAWLAIQTLPVLLQPAYECNDRTFATLFAAAMLQKVQKGATQRVTDENLERFLNKSLNKLKNNQLDEGGWSWTGKNAYSRFITCEVVSGFYKLQRMGIKQPVAQKMLAKAVAHADSVQEEAYREHLRYLESNPKVPYPLDYHDVLYLYMRSFLPVDSAWLSQPYVQCLLTTATQNITKSSYTRQAEVALVLHRFGRMQEAEKIVENLRKQAVTNSNQGMYWRRKYESRYYPWYEAPIEQQALLIEAFSEISPREEELSAMKQWLLLQKKGNEWQSTRATLAAVYALLLNFTADELEASTTTITVGGETFSTAGTADKKGTGYLQHTWNQEEITPSLGEVAVRTDAAHPVIGACHWQYWEDVEKVESEGSGLTISRTYFHQPKTAGGYAEPVTTDNPAHLGERITVRVTVTSDRDLDFVHVTDPRPASFEPVNENKRYFSMRGLYWVEHPRYVRWSQDIRDASTEFFFRHFPKGSFAVEYDVFATQTGEFTTGIPEVECLYAPEWRGHYDNAKVNVR